MPDQTSNNNQAQPVPMPAEGDIAAPQQAPTPTPSAPQQTNPESPVPTQTPPPPPSAPEPTIKPSIAPEPPMPEAGQTKPPPPPSGLSGNEVVTSGGKGRGGFPKKLIFVLLGILLLIGIAFVVIKVVLPRLGSVGIGPKNEITWWGMWEDTNVIQPIIDDYESQNPGVTIKYEKQDKEDYRERLASAIAKGDAPDIFRIHNSWVSMFSNDLSVMPANVMSTADYQNTFYPVATDNFLTGNGVVAIPLEFDGLAMYINNDIFTTYSQTIPTTWNEVRQTAKALTIKDERGVITQSGASLGTTSNVDNWQDIVALLMIQNGADPAKPKDDLGRGEQALRFYNQFSDVDGVWDDTLPSSTAAFASGRVAMYFGPSWRAFEIKDTKPDLNFSVKPIPQLTEDPSIQPITYASYWAEAVWNKSKNKDEAWKFLKYLSQKDTLQKLYEAESSVRIFGEPYSRVDMRDTLLSDPVVGAFVKLAPNAKSSYLYSRTFDGDSGINSSLSQYYEDALGTIKPSGDAKKPMDVLATGVQQVLSRYGLAAPIPTPTK